MRTTARPFHIPSTIPVYQQVDYCLSIIQKLRTESIPLRDKAAYCDAFHSTITDVLREWKNKLEKEKDEKEQWKDKYEKAQKEIEKLNLEIEKLTKTENRLNQAVFAHGNFRHPDSKDRKPNGGQKGHADTNRDTKRNTDAFVRQRIFAAHCGKCGGPLSRVPSVKKKMLLDIHINTEIIQLMLESERQWCGNCREEIHAQSPQALPFTEYGINTFMMVLLLRFRAHQSLNGISETLHYGFGLMLSESVINSILTQSEKYLRDKYDALIHAIQEGDIMYNDETSWLIKGEKAYMWIMATADTKESNGNVIPGKTVYVAAETKGKGVFEEMYGNSKAKSMHDGNPTYEGITGTENSLYCWTHVIRFAFEETIHKKETDLACQIRDSLVDLYLDIRRHPRTRDEKETIMRKELDRLIAISSTDETVKRIQHRVKTQKEGLILALLETEDGTNNLAEREFRQLVISRYISFGSATFTGMVTTAVLSSILQTIHRDTTSPFLPTLQSYISAGLAEKQPQYKHPPSFAP